MKECKNTKDKPLPGMYKKTQYNFGISKLPLLNRRHYAGCFSPLLLDHIRREADKFLSKLEVFLPEVIKYYSTLQ